MKQNHIQQNQVPRGNHRGSENHSSAWDDFRFGLGVPLLVLTIIVLIVALAWELLLRPLL